MGEKKKIGAGLHPIYQVIGYLDQRAPFPIGSILLGLVSGVYLANPGFGWLELINDNLPFVGNLDEAAFAVLLIWSGGNIVRWARIRLAQRKALEKHKEES
jgi:hypothetical protein